MPRPTSLSFDLLKTFVLLVDEECDAARVAGLLGINQPSMSKRLKYFQHAGPVLKRPWLARQGKSWRLTDEGRRALPGVRNLVYRYDQLVVSLAEKEVPDVRFACGQQAALGFVRCALRAFRQEHPQARLLVVTPRGQARIEGVANGLYDLATVTHPAEEIREIARRELHVETLARHRLALVSRSDTPWSPAFERLLKTKVPATALAKFPLILPEPDAGIRLALDATLRREALLRELDVRMEIGGWQAILAYVEDGVGVGLVSEAAIAEGSPLTIRFLDPAVFPPTEVRLICRHQFHAPDEPDLSPLAATLRRQLQRAAAAL